MADIFVRRSGHTVIAFAVFHVIEAHPGLHREVSPLGKQPRIAVAHPDARQPPFEVPAVVTDICVLMI